MSQPTIAVLGAGLQGACVALGLARRGFRTTLIERQVRPMLGASLRNEGKIHLGFVYALDPSGLTRRRMMECALSFAPLLDELCGPLDWQAMRSEGFRYAVMPDSLVGPEALETAYRHLDSLFEEIRSTSDRSPHYLGTRPQRLWRVAPDRRGRPRVEGRPVEHCYETAEASVDPRRLAAVITGRLLAEPRVELRCGVAVRGATRTDGGFRLALEGAAGGGELRVDQVVNCTWDDLVRLDRGVGIEPPGAVCYRVKHQVLVRPSGPARQLAPVTMVQGPFGDLVPWPDGTVYASWYPECRTYFGSEPPAADEVDPMEVAERTLAKMVELFPDLAGAEIVSSKPCTIVARGITDVDDPLSGLHERAGFGPSQHEGWWSIDTGKLTAAPLNAQRVVEAIGREIGHAVA